MDSDGNIDADEKKMIFVKTIMTATFLIKIGRNRNTIIIPVQGFMDKSQAVGLSENPSPLSNHPISLSLCISSARLHMFARAVFGFLSTLTL